MKSSRPFVGTIAIADKLVKCVFDSGASVFVIGAGLVKELGLIPSEDRIGLGSFEGRTVTDCLVILDVPVKVNGADLPERMCTQDEGDPSLCLLGMTWYRQYGVKQDLGRGA
ncbi:hypothetical protein DM01DRAFT_1342322 [Hesseltinella vesiculosa]|uniref:Peptidase A2 domain-containing protein n=1 Tax=Hesseltinella vesiculosa TaxID=101127 RepID=A0A1X2GTG5_9FUNG|nr:hypothetical protein DM01DRAFT_1342322 [Hesseltinella vesiculosa]